MTIAPLQAAPNFSGPLTHGFLLVEPTTLVHAPELLALDMQPCTPRALAHREELMPQLVDISALDDEARALATACWVAETHIERPPVVCAWLSSDAPADAICEHVARYLVGPGADGNPTFWRYYDPRVLSLTHAVLDSSQQRALFGPIQAWQFAWAGHRWCVTRSGADTADTDQPSGWPRREQWPRINCSEAADRVLRRLPTMSVEHAAQFPIALDRVFSEAILSGHAMDVDALVEYALQHLRLDIALDSETRGSKP
ncbi:MULTISPECIES: DUF4123 domain-containing protein [Burkholderia]|uniref:DUF4123 domain-containing protein n=1 Tax=Burkholderia TaxID=32008 RepID=UPI0009B2414E|nr:MULTISPECIES: DUF4123 domain-containing protein [Burkholderia]QVN11877.1 DUF4123 domain-containing protein [Burkholderia sp. LAS2]RQU46926.1 DUF4123 domain-containing protein [Burkholderia cenocepacia]RQU88021.1 DUF4123 domain-containing protein [Burkholderia cenocepacia]RQV25931.1 DUF4123 domain-containing protein [Burkholderia cenocepacia]RQV64497.1 DUF4123 domain-containing protein [Burkholderia cenocepacia]